MFIEDKFFFALSISWIIHRKYFLRYLISKLVFGPWLWNFRTSNLYSSTVLLKWNSISIYIWESCVKLNDARNCSLFSKKLFTKVNIVYLHGLKTSICTTNQGRQLFSRILTFIKKTFLETVVLSEIEHTQRQIWWTVYMYTYVVTKSSYIHCSSYDLIKKI